MLSAVFSLCTWRLFERKKGTEWTRNACHINVGVPRQEHALVSRTLISSHSLLILQPSLRLSSRFSRENRKDCKQSTMACMLHSMGYFFVYPALLSQTRRNKFQKGERAWADWKYTICSKMTWRGTLVIYFLLFSRYTQGNQKFYCLHFSEAYENEIAIYKHKKTKQ